MNKTGIEWCSMTWNVLRGCSWASPGCDYCYAEAIAKRFGHEGQPYEGAYNYQADQWSGQVKFFNHKLFEPLHVKVPQLIFANSMSDICHPAVKTEWVDAILKVVLETPWHFYMMLTKRPNRIHEQFYGRPEGFNRILAFGDVVPNLAMGTSIEQQKFLWRGYKLLEQWLGDCFLSIEPLLERLSIAELLAADRKGLIKQVIVGGESGTDARPMHPDWVRQLRDETHAAGRAFFFKQQGTWAPYEGFVRDVDGYFVGDMFHLGIPWNPAGIRGAKCMKRLGVKRAGRTLDGYQWNESPWPVGLPMS